MHYGHELGCHTYNHCECDTISQDTLLYNIVQNQKEIQRIISGYSMVNFAYPKGLLSFSSKEILSKNFHSMRGTYNGINCGCADLNLLRANPVYERIGSDYPLDLIEHNSQTR